MRANLLTEEILMKARAMSHDAASLTDNINALLYPKQPERQKVSIHLRYDRYTEFAAIAEDNNRSLSGLLETILTDWLTKRLKHTKKLT